MRKSPVVVSFVNFLMLPVSATCPRIAHRCGTIRGTSLCPGAQNLAPFPNSVSDACRKHVFRFGWSSQFSTQTFDQGSQIRFAGVGGVASCICDKVLGSFSAALGVGAVATHVAVSSAATAAPVRSKQSHHPPPRFPPTSLAPQVSVL